MIINYENYKNPTDYFLHIFLQYILQVDCMALIFNCRLLNGTPLDTFIAM